MATVIIIQVKNVGCSFKKNIEKNAAKIGAPATITKVLATEVY